MRYLEQIESGNAVTPDLFVLDLNLPVHNGIEVLRRIRTSPQIRAVPAVILTTSEAERDRVAAHELGIDLFLRKPTNLDDFAELGSPLKCLIRKHR